MWTRALRDRVSPDVGLPRSRDGFARRHVVVDSGRRNFLISTAFATLVMLDTVPSSVTARRTAHDPPGAKDGYPTGYCGNYRVTADHALGIDRFILEGTGEATLLVSDYQSGIVRRLFRVSDIEFVMGAGFNVRSPVVLRIRFALNAEGKRGVSLNPSRARAPRWRRR
jgi:hypothetical protein